MIAAGFGFRESATRESLADALRRACASPAPAWLATAEDKADHPALVALAAELGVGVRPIPSADLETQATLTRSRRSSEARNTGSVAEAAALASLGPGARLIASRSISGDRCATCALARKDTT
ncbi:cobalamin biosynthesis protein [Amaricoccus macauensis]|uniref:cobalamin biosynthesis protein n=1 Tax=Amaricoccus macauensis TaxID=57001 RepID=UPI003C7C0F9B